MTPIQLEPNPADRFGATTPEAAKNNTRYALLDQVRITNAAKIADYQTQWQAYAAARDARPGATNLIEPMPDFADAVYGAPGEWPYISTSAARVITPNVYFPPKPSQSSGGFTAGGAAGAVVPSVLQLMSAQVYGPPVDFAGMRFLRVG